MKIVLIGAGNVAYHLGPLLKKNGHQIIQIYSPTKTHGHKLAQLLSSAHTTKASSVFPGADIYLLAIKDEAIKPFLKKLNFIPKNIIHTSGSIGLDVFPKEMENAGVLYPLQTFSLTSKNTPRKIPICIEGRNKKTTSVIRKLAQSISKDVYEFNSEKRRILHLTAVFVNNFTNFLFTLSDKILKKNNISFKILMPLIEETVNKISGNNPREMQSGPARRGDKVVIKKHLQLLKNDPELKKIYKILSQNIAREYAKKI